MTEEDTEFVTAADLRAAEPAFDIPQRPQRRYPADGGVRYEGQTVFTLTPSTPREDDDLAALLGDVLADDRYTVGDWFDLPMPLYLVHDHVTGDTFRVAVRDGAVELHVLPATESPGLKGLYEGLRAAADGGWDVDCRTA